MIIDGKKVSAEKRAMLAQKIAELKERYNRNPKLATIMVGDSEASKMYVAMKERACHKIGIETENYTLESSTTDELLDLINKLNSNDEINGILVQHPLPKEIDEQKCFNAIATSKDVDGVNTENFGKMALNEDAMYPCTPKGIIELLDYYNIDIDGKKAVVIGRSPILGKPVSLMLLNKNATVTTLHSHSTNIADEIRTADIVVACVGIPNFVKKEWLKDGVVLIDAGYNKDNIGDIDKSCYEVSSYYTPVPGGVGPMTITVLMEQTTKSFTKSLKR